jgi:hypothetical protein
MPDTGEVTGRAVEQVVAYRRLPGEDAAEEADQRVGVGLVADGRERDRAFVAHRLVRDDSDVARRYGEEEIPIVQSGEGGMSLTRCGHRGRRRRGVADQEPLGAYLGGRVVHRGSDYDASDH